MPETPRPEVPKKSCLITLMFPVKDDSEALAVKGVLDKALEGIEEKRYNFQINENK